MHVTCRCGHKFQSRPAPCPDGRIGCLVAHYDAASFVCPKCLHDSGPAIAKSILDGNVRQEVGVGMFNARALAKLNIAH